MSLCEVGATKVPVSIDGELGDVNMDFAFVRSLENLGHLDDAHLTSFRRRVI